MKSCCFADSVGYGTGSDRFDAGFDRFGAGLELVLAHVLAFPFVLGFWWAGFDSNGSMAPLEHITSLGNRTPIGGTVGVQSRTDLFIYYGVTMSFQPIVDFFFLEDRPPVYPMSERGIVAFDPPFC